MGFLGGVKTFFKSLFNKLLGIFKKFIDEAFDNISKVVIAELKDFAITVVTELKNSDLTNEQKRKEAFKRIKKKALEDGKDIGDSITNVLIELAVQYVKNTTNS